MREKRARSHDKSEPLFDFQLSDSDFDEAFVVDVSGVAVDVLDSLVAQSRDLEALDSSQAAHHDEPESSGGSEPLAIDADDPLNPELFVGHHRRMEREERRMQMLERQQLIATASKVRQQREQLLRSEWRSHVEKIVKIHDINDINEVKRKRELALAEIQQFLQKFDEYNARYNRRESKPEDVEKKRLQAQQKRAKAAKQKIVKQRSVKTENLKEHEQSDEPLTLEFRPFAFGFMLPGRQFPPREYSLPPVLFEEVEAYNVAEKVNNNMPWLKRRG